MSTVSEIVVPAREGRGVMLRAGQLLDIIDLEGHQVGDLVAWRRGDSREYMSPAHTVSCNASIRLSPGSELFTNRRNPIFTILRDDVGKHDIVVPCCDPERYSRDFGKHDHPSCLRNLERARDLLGESFDIRGEQAWNVFMHNRVTPEGKVVTDPAGHPAGATITLRAEMDTVALLSACPQDLTPCNDFNPTPMKLVVREG
ncbi:MAG: urea carboxylase-associated family protein [Candidatus Acidiferrales bacterium]